MSKNIIDKIWESHIIKSEKDAPALLFIDLQLIHEVTSPQAFQVLKEKNIQVLFPDRNFATLDHSVPTDEKRTHYVDSQAKDQVEKLKQNCKDFGISLFDFGSGSQGIVHVIGPELGLTQPGKTIVCGDSHTSTHGAFGALAFGIGTTQISHVLATQCLLLDRPKTMKVEFVGTPSPYFTAKDAILALVAKIGIQGANQHAIEFCGEYIRNLSMEGRMTICNMSIEAGGRFGLVSPDEKTIQYLKNKKYVSKDYEKTSQEWMKLASSDDAIYDKSLQIDLEGLKSFVTWGTNPEQGIPVNEKIPTKESFTDPSKAFAAQKSLDYNGLHFGDPIEGTPIDYVFMGSCTNSRIEDMREISKILKNKKVHPKIKALIVPGSEQVRAQCEKEGLIKIFDQSGAITKGSGCSMCIAMNGDAVPEGLRCASTSNRNFVGRQGQGSFTHLMSPMMAAIASITGEITDPDKYFQKLQR